MFTLFSPRSRMSDLNQLVSIVRSSSQLSSVRPLAFKSSNEVARFQGQLQPPKLITNKKKEPSAECTLWSFDFSFEFFTIRVCHKGKLSWRSWKMVWIKETQKQRARVKRNMKLYQDEGKTIIKLHHLKPHSIWCCFASEYLWDHHGLGLKLHKSGILCLPSTLNSATAW